MQLLRIMIRSIKHLMNMPIQAIDGECGKVDDFLMSAKDHDVRHLIADIGQWPADEKVMLAKVNFQQMGNRSDIPSFPVRMLTSQVMKSADYDPSSRVLAAATDSYAERSYLTTPYEHGSASRFMGDDEPAEVHGRSLLSVPETHSLLSMSEVMGLPVEVMDGQFGCVSDFLVDDSNWRLQYMIIDSNRWLPGGIKYGIHIKRLDKIEPDGRGAVVKMKREQIEELSEYDPDQIVF